MFPIILLSCLVVWPFSSWLWGENCSLASFFAQLYPQLTASIDATKETWPVDSRFVVPCDILCLGNRNPGNSKYKLVDVLFRRSFQPLRSLLHLPILELVSNPALTGKKPRNKSGYNYTQQSAHMRWPPLEQI